jgi:hypothetical protein
VTGLPFHRRWYRDHHGVLWAPCPGGCHAVTGGRVRVTRDGRLRRHTGRTYQVGRSVLSEPCPCSGQPVALPSGVTLRPGQTWPPTALPEPRDRCGACRDGSCWACFWDGPDTVVKEPCECASHGHLPPLVYTVRVAVALSRPPRADEHRWYRLVAADAMEAGLVACWWAWASPDVVMVVGSEVIDVEV